ncbi:MAG: amidase [Spirochaetales bacterium]|nr:amidase [Spirochaetales bacterium]
MITKSSVFQISAVQAVQNIQALNEQGPRLRAVLSSTLVSMESARRADLEGKIPVLIKDNIDTIYGCTAGSLALGQVPVHGVAPLITRLEERGFFVVGKSNLSEWANFRSTQSSSGWSSWGGQTKNPYQLDRSPSGSSSGSGVAVASGMVEAAVGTETDGSIISPAAHAGIVGIKPTLGYISRTGVIPIAGSQDTPGPMARTVEKAAALLDAMGGYDPDDGATEPWIKQKPESPLSRINQKDLRGQRLGYFDLADQVSTEVKEVFAHALDRMRDLGAELINLADRVKAISLEKISDFEFTILLCEFKDDLARYFARRRPDSPIRNLEDLKVFNQANAPSVMPFFRQELVEKALATGGRKDPLYLGAKEGVQKLLVQEGLMPLFDENKIDGLVMPSNGPAWVRDWINGDRYTGGSSSYAAVSGWPSITFGIGHTRGLPLGMSVVGRPWSEATLIGIAQAVHSHFDPFCPPQFLPTFTL